MIYISIECNNVTVMSEQTEVKPVLGPGRIEQVAGRLLPNYLESETYRHRLAGSIANNLAVNGFYCR